ncbi:MAG: metallophosphoesterase [Polyangiaceae bacterium]|nr:metallophosphoesterase [Polyangiaceae bacterium]
MRPTRLWLLPLCACAVHCNSDPPREPASAPQATVAEPAPEDTSFRFPVAERLIAIGDVHGDVVATRAALRLGGAIDEKDEWIGGKLVVVQTGDQLDRGDDEPEILDLFDQLKARAKSAGGAVHTLSGNHEVMNVAGDFRYVTEGGFRDYGNTPLVGQRGKQASLLPPEQHGRAAAFLPGGPAAEKLAARPVVIVVGDTVFAHGGVLPGHVRYGLGKINDEARRWMLGESRRMPEVLNGDTSPVWSRDYSDGEPSARACGALDTVLADLKVKRIVVGHTVQKTGITSACGAKAWRIDVGLARHYGGRPAVLEIRGDELRALTGDAPEAGTAIAIADAGAPRPDAGKAKPATKSPPQPRP